jgi:transcriptional regulator with XRE-family HTH domain
MDLNLKVIFGMKLKRFREQAGLSLTDLASKTSLSTSYLTEIEHGKKYPKAEKIARMAEILGKSYDDLVSIKLNDDLTPLADFLSSPVLHNFPYHLFGISPFQVVELMTRQPVEASALVNALVGIAEQYNIGVEHLFRSALRSYQELNGNYFPEIEQAADEFRRTAVIECHPTPTLDSLRKAIEGQFNYRLDDRGLSNHPRLLRFRSVLVAKDKKSPLLLMNPALSDRQKKFILAREIGYQVLGLKQRAMTSAPDRVESFEQVLNDFKASYFAGALLMSGDNIVGDLKKVFALSRWQPAQFAAVLEKYQVTPEIFLYRLTEVLGEHFDVSIHFLRFNHENGRFRLVKHLNMSEVLIPGGSGLNEHYCRRWLAVRILRKLEDQGSEHDKTVEPIIDAQVSHFIESDARFLCFAMARRLVINPGTTSSVSIGFRWDEGLERTIKFAGDPNITRLDIDGTCERCRLAGPECAERAAPPHLLELQRAHAEVEQELASLAC